MLDLKKTLFVALFAVAALPAVASEPVQLPAQPIVAEAPKVEAPIATATEVLPTGGLKKEEGKVEEKKEAIKGEIKSEMTVPTTGAVH